MIRSSVQSDESEVNHVAGDGNMRVHPAHKRAWKHSREQLLAGIAAENRHLETNLGYLAGGEAG
jgi:hypothetical protein